MSYILHLNETAMEKLIREHDEWDGDIMDINIDPTYSAWVNMDGTSKHITLMEKRKKLKRTLDKINGLI